MRSLDPERVCQAVGRRIAELRRGQGMTQEQFGVLLGTSFQWISQIEGGRNLTLHSLVRVANALKVPMEDLLAPPRASHGRTPGRPPKGTTRHD